MVRGEQQFEEDEYKVCGFCGLEIKIPLRDRKKRIEHFDKTKLVKEPVDDKKRRYNNKDASDKKRNSIKTGNGATGRTGSRGGSRQGSN